MTCGERVKDLRKTLNLTLEEFGSKVGVTKQTISRIENGVNNLTDQMLISICREYNVSEEWLRDGTGEMFIPLTRNQVITDFAGDIIKEEDTFKKRLIEALAKLNENEWAVLEKLAQELTKEKD